MNKSYLKYKDIAPGAAEDAAVSSASGTEFSDLNFSEEKEADKYISLEPNRWILGGDFVDRADRKVSFWSNKLSGDDCKFQNPPVITIEFDEQYSSTGISMSFDSATGEYCRLVGVEWYKGSALLSSVDFEISSSSVFLQNTVESYNKIVITLKETSLPSRRARVERIVFGVERVFGMTELRSVDITNETDISSLALPISDMDWVLESKDPVEFLFQLKQPVECWHNDSLIGVYYIDSHRRDSRGGYSISCYDAVGVLSESTFNGGVYSNKSGKELLGEIIGDDFEVVYEVEDVNLTGILVSQTKREAIQQVLFAAGWCLSTDGRESIRIFIPSDDTYEVGEDKTFPGISVSTAAIVTSVSVFAHSYTQNTNGSIEVNGVKYTDTETEYVVNNPNVTANDKKNVKTVRNATLISSSNAETVAKRLYDYYTRRNTLSAKFVWNGERLGDCIEQPTPWGTTEKGTLSQMNIGMSNTVVADSRTIGL